MCSGMPWARSRERSTARNCAAPSVWAGSRAGTPAIRSIGLLQHFSILSPARFQIIRALQNDAACTQHLDSLRTGWRATSVIHGDIRASNVLVAGVGNEPSWNVRIVDWEMVQLGDPAWDLAGALQAFVRFWVESMPMAARLSIDERVARAQLSLELVQELCRSLWSGYQVASGMAKLPEADLFLDRAVTLSAARLIQSAYEVSELTSDLDARAVILLQMGVNVLARPTRSRMDLFGIPPAEAVE